MSLSFSSEDLMIDVVHSAVDSEVYLFAEERICVSHSSMSVLVGLMRPADDSSGWRLQQPEPFTNRVVRLYFALSVIAFDLCGRDLLEI